MNTKMLTFAISAATTLFCFAGPLQADLINRGGGLIYDSDLDVTWLQDANYAQTSGHDADGLMNYVAASDWAANLGYYDSVRGVTYDDWRLPNATDVNSDGATFTNLYQGVDFGYNITVPSELSYMFYQSLGNLGEFDTAAFPTACAPDQCLTNTGPFINLQSQIYWTNEESGLEPTRGFIFDFRRGFQRITDWGNVNYAWAVRDGDVVAPTAEELMVELINDVIALNLKKGIANALDAKLENSLAALEDANSQNGVSAINMLFAFINNVDAQRGIHISHAEADALIASAQEIIDLLSGL